ncbi:hypothetical protein VU09_35875 [Burkholderia pseudomallei]|nr:hypothetical protein VU09_35875 [Burkholderia pseudomallei]
MYASAGRLAAARHRGRRAKRNARERRAGPRAGLAPAAMRFQRAAGACRAAANRGRGACSR